MRGSRSALLASVLLVAGALSACGGGDSRHVRGGPSTEPDPCGVCGSGRPPQRGPIVIQGAQQGGTVQVLTHDGLAGVIDPSGARAPDILSILSGLVTRSLTQYRYDPRTQQMVLAPDLATDLGVHNDDYTQWVYEIRRDVQFQDGSPVTARDVARGILRCFDAHAFPTGLCQEYAERFGGGVRPRKGVTKPHRPFTSLEVRGSRLIFTFARPTPDLPYLAAFPELGPVPGGRRSDPATYGRHPLATGPYQIKHYRPGHLLVLVRNRRWRPVSDPVRTAYPARYVVRSGVPNRRIERLLTSDTGAARTTLTYDDVARFAQRQGAGLRQRLTLGPKPCTTYWAPDNRTITDPRVRHALAYAFPYQAVLRAEGLVPNVTAFPANSLLPASSPEGTGFRLDDRGAFVTDPAGARRLLASAHATGTRIGFVEDPQDRTSRQIGPVVSRGLRAAGFDPQAVSSPSSARVDVRLETRCGHWNTGSDWLPELYDSGEPADVERFSQPSVEHRIRHIETLPFAEQAPAWNVLDQQVMKRWVPVVPLWYGGVAMAHGSRIQGMYDDSVHGMPTWQQLWVSTEG